VNRYLEILFASLATFAATNIDDAFLLTLFFARRIPAWRIAAGQYLGFAIIIAVSLIGATASSAIPHNWIRLLGLLPLALGIKHLLRRRTEAERQSTGEFGVVSIALVTMSNGADNIGVYVPFFVVGRTHLWLILIVYAVLVGVWCSVGGWLGTRPLIFRLIDRWADRAVPAVFILLGAYVLNSR
jgi:cadmium resistance protein CadD (predicted permease)